MRQAILASTRSYVADEICSFRNGDSLSTGSKIISSIESSPQGDYFATAGVLKTISIFDLQSNIDHLNTSYKKYPVLDIKCVSKISCLSWNAVESNTIYSADYDGVLNAFDPNTGVLLSSRTEHEKRCWTVDSSILDPFKVLTGSDDCKVKLWTRQSHKSAMTIEFRANVCSVKFSPNNSNLIAVGAADHRVFLIDLRKPSVPLLNEKKHLKSVSYVKFMDDGNSLISSSTDSTLRRWSSNNGIWGSDQIYSGHLNEKNFVGLSCFDNKNLIATGSEDNSVVFYDKHLDFPVLKHKLNTNCPLTGNIMNDELGTFISSVAWSNALDSNGNPILLVGNSSGNVKVLSINTE
jgi:E3 ubiquitin-protein ligase RFWD2